MKIIYNPDFDLKFSDYGIEIPIVDDRAFRVFNELKKDFGDLNVVDSQDIPMIDRSDLELVHNKDFIDELYKSNKSLEFQMLTAYELIDLNGEYHRYNPANAKKDFNFAFNIVLKQVGLTYLSSLLSLKNKFSYFLGGGMHHAMTFGGRGFCLVNDIMITIKKLQKDGLIKSAWVIDVDAHKGDGTSEISKLDKSVTTLSIHMKEGWPLNSGSFRDPWFIPSNVEIGIDVGEENTYLDKLKLGLLELKKLNPNPDIAIIVNGADPFEFDELESTMPLKLSKEQLLERDILVYSFLEDLNIPQSYLMAGGYGPRSWEIYYQFLKFVGKSSS